MTLLVSSWTPEGLPGRCVIWGLEYTVTLPTEVVTVSIWSRKKAPSVEVKALITQSGILRSSVHFSSSVFHLARC